MTNVRIVVNDSVEFDGDPGEWQQQPPDLFKEVIKPDAKPRPWLAAIMAELTDAYMRQESVNIDVTYRSNRWEMKAERL